MKRLLHGMQLGVWESHKQGAIDPSMKMQRLRFLASCPSKYKTTPMSHMWIILKKLDGPNFTNPPPPIHIFWKPITDMDKTLE